jgi:subtilisin family serine protease
MNILRNIRSLCGAALALASFTSTSAQVSPGTPFFYAGGERYPLTESSGWIAVRVDEDASPAAVEMALAATVEVDPTRQGVYHSKYRILVQPVTETQRPAVAQQADATAAVEGVQASVRMFHNGKLSPIIETDEFLIQFTPDIPRAEIDEVLAQHGAEIARPLGSYAPNGYVVRMRDAQSSSIDAANKLHGLRGVVYSHPNFIWPKEEKFIPNDPLYQQQWHLNNTGSNGPPGLTGGVAGADIKAERAWEITRGSSNVVVAIVDDGVNTGHEDFRSTNKIKAGWDFVDNDNTPVPDPALDSLADTRRHNNHGTSCAGLAVANGDNALGTTGVAPGARLMSVRLLGANQTPETEAAAISSARDNGATIISNSWGPVDRGGPNNTSISQPCPDNVFAAIRDVARNGRGGKGCVVLWAAGNGNESVDLDGYASHPDVICVAATTNQDRKASYSDFGNAIDVCAPGSEADMVTTDRMGSVGYNAGNYTFNFNGTSAATPVAAGVAALILSKEPNLTAEQVFQRMIDTADFVDTANETYDANGHNRFYGFGRVNAWNALATTDSSNPTVTIRVPSAGLLTSNLAAADGTMSDTGLGVYRVEVALEDSSGRWWNWQSGSFSAAGVSFDGSIHGKNATLSADSWSVALPDLAAGSYRLHAKAVDKADNESPYISSAFTIDPLGPRMIILEPKDGHNYDAAPQASGVAGDNIVEKRYALFRETDQRWYNWNTNSFDSGTFDYPTHVKYVVDSIETWTFNLPSLNPARYQLHALAIDSANRGTDWVRRDFRVGLPPVVRVTSPGHRTGIQDLTSIDGTVEDPSGKGFQGNEVKFTLYNDGSFWTGTEWSSTMTVLRAPVNGSSWSYSAVPSGSNERSGEYFVSASVRDNTDAASVPTTGVNQTSFRIDRTPPQVAIDSPANGMTITAKNFQFRGTSTDVGGVQGVYLFVRRASDYTYWNGSGWGSAPVVLSSNYDEETGQWVSSGGLPALGGNADYQMANGSYNFIAIAIDHAGNQTQTDSVVTVDFHEIFTYTAGSFSDGIAGNDNHNWSNPRNWDPIGVPTPQDIVIIAHHTVRSAVPLTVYGFRMSSGALDFDNGAHSLTILKNGRWTGGTLVDITNIHANATIEISDGATKAIGYQGVINNFGTVVWSGGPIQGYQHAQWNNKPGSVFMAAGDGDVFANYYAGNVFNNEADAAFIKVSGGSDASSYLDEWTFNNAGRIESQEGTLHFNLTLNLNPGSNFAGIGRILLNGTTNVATNVVSNGRAELISTLNGNTPDAGISTTQPFAWTAGSINGRFTLAAGSVLDLVSGHVKQLGYEAVFTNRGQVNWRAGLLQGYQNSVFNNESGAVFKMMTDGDVFANYYQGNVFNNKAGASFVKSGRSDNPNDISYVDEWTFNNSGAIRSDTGVLRFHTALHLHPGGTIARDGGAVARVRSTGHFVLTGTTSVSNIIFEAGGDWHGNTAEGTAGNGTITTSGGGLFEWTAGTAYNTVNIAPGAAFTISGSDTKQLGYAAVLNNHGKAVWTGTGALQGYQNSTFANLAGATFTAESDADFVNYYGGNTFVNSAGATFEKTGGTEDTRCDWGFNNNGVARSSSGALAFNSGGTSSGVFAPATGGTVQFTGGNHHLITTAKFEGTGRTQMRGGTVIAVNHVNESGAAAVLDITGGTVTSAPNGSFNAVGTVNWTGGTIAGTFNITAGSALHLSGDHTKQIGYEGVINNFGAAIWSGPGLLQGYQHSSWNNKPGSSFTAASDGDLFANYYGGNTFRNEANASFIKTAGASNSSTYLDEWTFHNAGQLDSRQGTLHINLTLNLNPGSSMAGAGRILLDGTTNLATKLTSTGNPEFVNTLNGNTPDAGFSGTNPFVWSNGTINGRFTLAAGSILDLASGHVKQIGYDSVFTNHGRVNWKAGLLRGYQRSSFNNESGGVFDVVTDGDVFANYYGGNVFNNKAGALFVKSGRSDNPDDISFIDEWTFNNSGAIRSDTGVLRFHTAFHLEPGGIIARDGDAPARVRSTHYFVLIGTTTVSNTVFEAAGDWHGNTGEGTAGNGTIATTDSGIFEWTAGTAHNTVNIAAGSAFALTGPHTKQIGYHGVLNNHGYAIWTGSGAIQGYQNSTLANRAGGTFVAATDADFANYYWGNKFINGGNFVVGAALGVTDMAWDYEQASTGLLHIHLAGTNPATPEFDQLKIHGRATLAGVLSVNLLNAYLPVPDTSYRVLTFGSHGGTFGLVHSLGSVMKLEYSGNNLTIVAKEHAETNTEWKQYFFGDPTSPQAQPLADANGDGLPNLIEYALGRDPLASGGGLPFGLGVGGTPAADGTAAQTDAHANATGHLMLTFTRPAGAAALKDVSYTVQRDTSLVAGNWSSGDVVQESAALSGDGLKETITMRSAHALGSTPAEFLRLNVTLTGEGGSSAATEPIGATTVSIAANGSKALAFGLDNLPAFVGSAATVAANTIQSTGARWTVNAFGPYDSKPHVLRMLSGSSAGRQYRIASNTADTVTLATDGIDLTAAIANGDRFAVIPTDSLQTLFGATAPELTRNTAPGAADNVQVRHSLGWFTYFNDGAQWLRQGAGDAAQNNVTLSPEQGIMFVHRGNAAKPFTLSGLVPTTNLKTDLPAGKTTMLGNRFPQATTLAALGLHTATGWAANANPAAADQVLIREESGWATYYHDGTNWLREGAGATPQNPEIGIGQAVMVVRRPGTDLTLDQPRPY